MLPTILSLLLLATAAIALPRTPFASRQAPNTIYPSDPLGQTASWNLTAFALPIKKSLAQSMANGHKLLPVRGLPAGYLKEDEHPLILYGGLQHDIRQVGVTIPNLVVSISLLSLSHRAVLRIGHPFFRHRSNRHCSLSSTPAMTAAQPLPASRR